jgi:hypothetical protein
MENSTVFLFLSAMDSRRERDFESLGDGRRQPRHERMVKKGDLIVVDEKIRCKRMRCHL